MVVVNFNDKFIGVMKFVVFLNVLGKDSDWIMLVFMFFYEGIILEKVGINYNVLFLLEGFEIKVFVF